MDHHLAPGDWDRPTGISGNARRSGRGDGFCDRVARASAPVLVVLIAIPAVRWLFGDRLIASHDAIEHVMRLAEYVRGLQAGILWPTWSANLGRGYGEPVFLFNPPLLYALSSVPALAGHPIVWSLNLTTAVLIIAGSLGMFAWARPVLGRKAGVVAAAAYVWAPYVLLDVYVRQALTELAAVALLPWALWAVSRTVLIPGTWGLAIAAFAVAGLLLASTPAYLVAAPALAGQLLVLADWRRRGGIVRGLAALALGVSLAAIFWLPAATERQFLRFDRLLEGRPAYANHFVEPWQLTSAFWGYGPSLPGSVERIGFGLGETNLALAGLGVIALCAGLLRGVAGRQGCFAAIVGLVGVGMTGVWSQPIWEHVADLAYLQFPWRFLMLAAFGSAALASLPVAVVDRRNPKAGLVLGLTCVAIVVSGNWNRAVPRELVEIPDASLSAQAIAARDRGQTTAYEYETIWTAGRPHEPATERLVVRSGSARVETLEGLPQRERFLVTTWGRSRLRLNTYYFPGWHVFVEGQERPIEFDNPSGLMELILDRGEHVVEVRFEPTVERELGMLVSLSGLMVLVGLILHSRRPARLPRVIGRPYPLGAKEVGRESGAYRASG